MAEVYSTTNEANGNILDKIKEKINGTTPDSGVVYVNKRGEVALALKYKNKCYIKSYDSDIKQSKDEKCLVPIDYLMVVDETNGENQKVFNSEITKEQIEKIITVSTNEVPNDVLGSFDVSENQNGSIMAWYKDEDNNGLYELYIGQDGGVKANPNSLKLFNYYTNVTSIDLNNLDTSNVTNMRWMFYNCQSLISLDLSNFNTSKATTMYGMFNDCQNLTSLDLSNFNTVNVTNMMGMFEHCKNLTTLDLSSFDTSKVKYMQWMFSDCQSLTTLDLSNFNTSNVTLMNSMFAGCIKLVSLNISSFNTSKVTNMQFLFAECWSLTEIDLSNFNTSNVIIMSAMFKKCQSLTTLDLSNFDTSSVTNMQSMFSNCLNLKTVKMNKADFNKVTLYNEMFNLSKIEKIIVKDDTAKEFIESRLSEASITSTIVEIG